MAKSTRTTKKSQVQALPALEPQLQQLRTWNWSMSVVHLAQAAAMFWLSRDFRLPITSTYLEFNPATQMLEPVLQAIAEVKVGPLVAGFFLLSALAHFLVAGPFFKWYTQHIARGINPARWIEYAFSSSLMLIVIALLVGIYDVGTMILLFGINAAMIFFGWLMELHNQSTRQTNWTSFWFGSIVGFVPWLVILVYLLGADDPPTFVYWIYGSIFITYMSFAVNMALQYNKIGKWADYLYGERAYMIWSLVAKSLLAWQVWAGTLRPI